MSSIGYTRTRDGLSLTISGRSFYIKDTDSRFSNVKEALKEVIENGASDEVLLDLLDRKQRIIDFSHAELDVRNNSLYFRGEQLPEVLSSKILNLYEEGFPFTPFIRFYERLLLTPSRKVLIELLKYLEAGNWPLLPDGRVVAYKVVRSNGYKGKDISEEDANAIRLRQKPAPIQYESTNESFVDILRSREYIDIYSNSVPQGVGDVLAVPRNSVDDDGNNTCSYGLHVCSYSYTSHYGNAFSGNDTVLEVAVCPGDWVSVPPDYNCAKARVCRYEILAVHTELTERREALYQQRQELSEYDYTDDKEYDDNYYESDEAEDDYEDEEGE